MVDYGLMILNSSGSVLIDETYKNYTYKEKGSTAISAGWNTISFASSTTHNVAYGVRPTASGFIYFGGVVKSGSSYTGFRILSTASMTLPWIVFEDTQQNALASHGLVVYDSAGSVVFSSNEKYMKLLTIDNSSATAGLPGGTPGTITVTSAANNYFYMQTSSFYYRDWNYTNALCRPMTGEGYKIWGTGLKYKDADELYEYTENEIFSGTTSRSPTACGEGNHAAGSDDYTLLEIEDTS